MQDWIPIFLPLALLMARVTACVAVLPIFGWQALPVRVRASLALVLTVFFAFVTPPPPADLHWMAAVVLLGREVLTGLAIGLAVQLVFSTVAQCGRILGSQMGTADAGTFDPVTGSEGQAIGTFFEMTFTLFFLTVGGHRLLLMLLARSYQAFPAGQPAEAAAMAEAIVRAGSIMLLMALKMAAPILAAFLVLSVVLAILARVLPEMNILLASFPLRMGLGLFIGAAMVPTLDSVTMELAQWMNEFLL